jgi:DNA-binding NtrC family response regulator
MIPKLDSPVTAMKIQALKFPAKPPGKLPERSHLESGDPEELKRLKETALRAAFVLAKKDLDPFRKLPDLVLDCGKKHKSSGLTRYLLGREKIPLIEGEYVDPGQLRRSIRALLNNAAVSSERNLYLIGVGESVFKDCWDQAGTILHRTTVAGRGKAGSETQNAFDDPESGDTVSRYLLDFLGDREDPEDLKENYVGESAQAKLVRQLILRAADMNSTVLIIGDNGTGKEIVAKEIHLRSGRPKANFSAVNCAGIPRDLLESLLFGHEEGSFSGAVRRKIGDWESASGGTLFLDEVGDLSLDHQAKILRALEDKKIRPVGSNKDIPVDARVIAATNRDLFTMVQKGAFREDLYYRLREFLIRTPSLRNHPGDIPLVAQALWRRITRVGESPLPREILEDLKLHQWPGNARELKTVLNFLYTFFGTRELRPEYLRVAYLSLGQDVSSIPESHVRHKVGLKEVECINHLRKVEEVVHATGVAISSFGKKKHIEDHVAVEAIADLLQQRIGELEVLCLQPLLFCKESVCAEVNRFKGSLVFFQGMIRKDVHNAVRDLKRDVIKGLDRLKKGIGREVRLLLSGTS